MDALFLGLRHVALSVRDVRKSLAFYSTVLGMKLEWMPDEQNAYLTSGQDNLALHQLPAGSAPGLKGVRNLSAARSTRLRS